jgi:hypothetical protein
MWIDRRRQILKNTEAGLGSAQAGGGAKASPKESEKNIIAWLIRPPDPWLAVISSFPITFSRCFCMSQPQGE